MYWLASLFLIIAALSPKQALEIGVKVWQNECSGTHEGLTCWNEGEEFASLGIGHFIWYPSRKSGPFVETFPELIQFFKTQGVDLPRWLEEARCCPWKTRAQFLRAAQLRSKQIVELRQLLQKTVPLQAQFLDLRLEKALPALLANGAEEKRTTIQARYERIRSHPNGIYVLLDYVNFKGYGTSKTECYNGWGWGLYQVLDNMSDQPDADVVVEFVRSAKVILERRVQNAPSQRNEERYLKGWFHRLDTYTH